jgi:hypothetical protein
MNDNNTIYSTRWFLDLSEVAHLLPQIQRNGSWSASTEWKALCGKETPGKFKHEGWYPTPLFFERTCTICPECLAAARSTQGLDYFDPTGGQR